MSSQLFLLPNRPTSSNLRPVGVHPESIKQITYSSVRRPDSADTESSKSCSQELCQERVTVRYHRNVTVHCVQTKIEVMYSRKRLYFEGPRMPWPQPHIRKSHRFKISLRSGIAVICFTNAHAPAGSIHNIHNRDRIRCQSEGPDHL